MLVEGIETDMIEALTWLIISAREGNNGASAYAGPVAQFTTRQQRVVARKKNSVLEKGPQKAQFRL